MSDDGIVYSVSTRYKNEGLREATHEAEQGHVAYDRMGEAMEHAASAMERLNALAERYVGFEILKRAAEGVVHEFVHLGSEMEALEIQFAGMMQAGGAAGLTGPENFERSMGASAELIAKMRQDARELPGEFQDLVNVFQPVLATGLQSGRSIADVERFSARMMATSASMHIQSTVAGHELEGMLMGRASPIMPLWRSLSPIIAAQAEKLDFLTKKQREGLHTLEEQKKVWHELTVDQRMKVLLGATNALQPAIDRVGQSWVTLESTAEDYLKTIKLAAGAPVFEEAKKILGEMLKYYEGHKEHIDHIAEVAGTKLAGGLRQAFEYGKSLFGYLVDNKDTLIRVAEAYAAIHLAQRATNLVTTATRAVGSGVGAAGGLVSILRGDGEQVGTGGGRVATAIAQWAARRFLGPMAGGGAAATGGALGKAIHVIVDNLPGGGVTAAGGALGEAATAAGGELTTLTGGLSSLGGAAGPAAVALASLVAQFETLKEIGQKREEMGKQWRDDHQELIDQERAVQANWENYLKTGEGPERKVTESEKDDVKRLAAQAQAVDWDQSRFWSTMPQELYNAVTSDQMLNTLARGMTEGVIAANTRPELAAVLAGETEKMGWGPGGGYGVEFGAPESLLKAMGLLKSVLEEHGTPAKPLSAKGTTINIVQHNNVYEADDPDRVRVVIKEGLMDALYHPTHSSTGPGVGR